MSSVEVHTHLQAERGHTHIDCVRGSSLRVWSLSPLGAVIKCHSSFGFCVVRSVACHVACHPQLPYCPTAPPQPDAANNFSNCSPTTTTTTTTTTTNRIVCTFCMQHAVRMRNRNRVKERGSRRARGREKRNKIRSMPHVTLQESDCVSLSSFARYYTPPSPSSS